MKDKYKNLVEMWEEGKTSTEIAKALGVTRNAVMGKIFRLKQEGFALRSKIKPLATLPLFPEESEPEPVSPPKPEKKEQPPKFKKEDPVEDQPDLPLNLEDGVTILDLEHWHCRYIKGVNEQKETLYCGKPQHYKWCCEEHHRLCYLPPPAKIKKKEDVDA
jgi:hypothetical protein